jgi:hypothetical protein
LSKRKPTLVAIKATSPVFVLINALTFLFIASIFSIGVSEKNEILPSTALYKFYAYPTVIVKTHTISKIFFFIVLIISYSF